ncbi:MAG: M90 family metallopeptidase [Gammaproteobacteria bacterium]
MNIFRRMRVRYLLRRHALPHRLWWSVCASLAVLQGLSAVEKAHLRVLCTLFLRQKKFVAAQELPLTAAMRLAIAAQACLPILKLGLEMFSEWSTVIVYPDAFRIDRDVTDEHGIVHRQREVLCGESWERGPLIVSWATVEKDRLYGSTQGHNVVIHEIAHKLDMLDGSANGIPPLHYRMPVTAWSDAFSNAYARMQMRLEEHRQPFLDAYATVNPAEFFAVVSEYFFAAPDILHGHFPDVYRQLRLYYRQDPLQRLRQRHEH